MRIFPTNTKVLVLGSLLLGAIVGAVMYKLLSPYVSLVEIVLMIGGLFIATVSPSFFGPEQGPVKALLVMLGAAVFLTISGDAVVESVRTLYFDRADAIPPALERLPDAIFLGGLFLVVLWTARYTPFKQASKNWKGLWYRLTTAGLSKEKERALQREVEREFSSKH